jgi:predicted polyphosphate/ATP-dependent NAD kinase
MTTSESALNEDLPTERAVTPFVTLDEAADILGITTGGVRYYFPILGISPRKFKGNKHVFLSREQVRLIQDARERPWTIGEQDV